VTTPEAAFTIPGTPVGAETVLVVEDEASVRRLIASILELHGYRVLTAGTASEALNLVASFDEPIDLLLTDLDIPDMTGRELAQRLRAARQGMTLLYMSGRTEDDVANYGVLASGSLFLHKPFTPYGLAWRVREVLDAAPDGRHTL
jgi:DNA-binding response OmpR family regulator